MVGESTPTDTHHLITKVRCTHPQQAGLVQWPDFIVQGVPLPGGTDFVNEGDYTQLVRDLLEEEFPGIWGEQEFGQDPRELVVTETITLTFPDEDAMAAALSTIAASNFDTLREILLGLTYLGPNIDYSIHPKVRKCLFERCVTLAEMQAGLILDWAIGLRLPFEVRLTVPDEMTQGTSNTLSSVITGLDWTAADYTAAGVAAENGNEWVLRFQFFVGAFAKIAGITVFDRSINLDLDKSTSFTSPFGPNASFPIPSVVLTPLQTQLEVDFLGMASLGIGLTIDPDLGSEKITAFWSATGDASTSGGPGGLLYTSPGTNVAVGPMTADDFDSTTDLATIKPQPIPPPADIDKYPWLVAYIRLAHLLAADGALSPLFRCLGFR